MAERQATDSRRGQRAAVVAGLLGLVPAASLGALRFVLGEQPVVQAQVAGSLAFSLVYMSPYLVTLAVSRAHHPAMRGALLLALGLLSMVASFSSLAGVTVVLLPATVAIFVASVKSIRVADHAVGRGAPSLLAGLVGVAVIGLSFYALFGLQADEARCWALTRGANGQETWHATPNLGGPNELALSATGPSIRRSICTSDIITNSEAAVGMGILTVGALSLIGISRLTWGAPSLDSRH